MVICVCVCVCGGSLHWFIASSDQFMIASSDQFIFAISMGMTSSKRNRKGGMVLVLVLVMYALIEDGGCMV